MSITYDISASQWKGDPRINFSHMHSSSPLHEQLVDKIQLRSTLYRDQDKKLAEAFVVIAFNMDKRTYAGFRVSLTGAPVLLTLKKILDSVVAGEQVQGYPI